MYINALNAYNQYLYTCESLYLSIFWKGCTIIHFSADYTTDSFNCSVPDHFTFTLSKLEKLFCVVPGSSSIPIYGFLQWPAYEIWTLTH